MRPLTPSGESAGTLVKRLEGKLPSRHNIDSRASSRGCGEETTMSSDKVRVFVAGAAVIVIGICAETTVSANKSPARASDPVSIAAEKGAKWLVSVQGKDGGW